MRELSKKIYCLKKPSIEKLYCSGIFSPNSVEWCCYASIKAIFSYF